MDAINGIAIYLYSAFYDDRQNADNVPYIRILALAAKAQRRLYCRVWYSGGTTWTLATISRLLSGNVKGQSIMGVVYYQMLYSCGLPTEQSGEIPTHVSILFRSCSNSSTFLPIIVPEPPPWKHEFGICVAISFRTINKNLFIEWMEFNKLLGVTEINIYNASLISELKPLLKYYTDCGLLRLHQLPPPVADYSKNGSKLSSPTSLNDCMMKNMYRYKHLVVLDFDELIIPKQLSTYSAMMKLIDKKHNLTKQAMSYSFRNTYYFSEYRKDETEPDTLTTMRYRQHAAPNNFLFATKSFINPRYCLSIFNHYCYMHLSHRPANFTVDVDTSIATSHHYTTCHFKKNTCKEYALSKTVDEDVLVFKNELKNAVDQVRDDLKRRNSGCVLAYKNV